ncbi:ABC transporter [Candidatus Gottesmanbacteria bacterium RBG_16_43_7]|uniref:ABC transporter n=1 Tax=Candidatus Gottesmanbacteria bacterium RBG_16_43_7 TaxID=1798373 RepID=A0A1F5Z824_9BACT|nr:MAG: ABC transporter [Candidatus Gottesmanbacteria bacterium RBG_16_43_7]
MSISVAHLSKIYRIHKKAPGLLNSISSLFLRQYESIPAVKDISFTVQSGELIGFIGPNGAGKTTTLKCLSGLLYPTHGDIKVLGFNPFDRNKKFLQQIALVMGQKNQLWWDLPPMETFLLNKEIYEIDDLQFKKTLAQLTDLLDVSKLLSIQVRKLSLGERMKMELIAALIHSPKVLFLDEPTIGLDVVMQKKVRDFIGDYNKLHQSTILLTSHYMEDVRQLAQRVLVIDRGQILYDGTLTNLVNKYAKYKTISIVLDEHVDVQLFRQYGQIDSIDYPKVTIKVARGQTKATASALLQSLPINDLNIEEPDIEDIIRDVFSSSQQKPSRG